MTVTLNHFKDILLLAPLTMTIPDRPMEGLGQWPGTSWGDYHNDVGVRWQEGAWKHFNTIKRFHLNVAVNINVMKH